MSSLSSWSYTAAATLWPLLARDGWDGAQTFGTPEVIACDYSGDARTLTDAKGREFVSRQTVYTERAGIKQGDRILVGISAAADPISVGALEVRLVRQHADTFERRADDYEVSA